MADGLFVGWEGEAMTVVWVVLAIFAEGAGGVWVEVAASGAGVAAGGAEWVVGGAAVAEWAEEVGGRRAAARREGGAR